MIQLEDNIQKIVDTLLKTKRENVSSLINYLLHETDFKTAPASTKYHLHVQGGLAEHSLNVLRYALYLNKEYNNLYPEESIILVSLLHDLCKANYYVEGEEWDKEYKESHNQWRKKKVWKVDEKEPLGHGEKSAIIASQYIKLTTDELVAIRWHMQWSDPGVHFNYPSGHPFRASLEKYPLLKILSLADEMAELYESLNYKNET